jgi:hypothetical protein
LETEKLRSTVHFDEKLIESVFALVVASETLSPASFAPNSIDFVDEDDARAVLSCLSEQVANSRWTHSNEHFQEF